MRDLSAAVALAEADLETRSLPALARSYPRRFGFYVARPAHSIPLKTAGRSVEVRGGPILFLAEFEPGTATKIKMQIARSDDVRSRRFFPIRPAPPKPCAQAGDLWAPATGRWGMRRT